MKILFLSPSGVVLILFRVRFAAGGGGGSFNLIKMMEQCIISPKITKPESGEAQENKVGGHAAEDQKQIRTVSTRINDIRSVHMNCYSRDKLIQSIIY